MRTVSIRLAMAALLFGCANAAWAQTADEIVERSVTAMGGRAALGKLKSRSTTGTITLSTPAGEINGTIETLNAAPNKVRVLIKADLTALGAGPMVLDQRFDGSSGYAMDSLQGNRDITGNQLDNMKNGASFPHPFLNYKQMGTSAKLGGKEKVGERDAYVLIFDPTSGSVVTNYIDAESYLPLRSVLKVNVPQIGQDVEQTSDFLDYREVDGVKIPFRFEVRSSIQNFTVVATKVEHNGPVDEALFVKPAAK